MSAKMGEKVFVDSNIFLYTLDSHDDDRRDRAKTCLQSLGQSSRIIVSTQVLNEVFAVATRKFAVEPVMAKKFVRQLNNFDVVLITSEIIEAAMDCAILHQLNYWDALMIAAAEISRCDKIWTEDLADGSVIRGVEIVNPLRGT